MSATTGPARAQGRRGLSAGDVRAISDYAHAMGAAARRATTEAVSMDVRAIAAHIHLAHPTAAWAHLDVDYEDMTLRVQEWSTRLDPDTRHYLDDDALEDALNLHVVRVADVRHGGVQFLRWDDFTETGQIDIVNALAGVGPILAPVHDCQDPAGHAVTVEDLAVLEAHADAHADIAWCATIAATDLTVRALAGRVRHAYPRAARVKISMWGIDHRIEMLVDGWASAEAPEAFNQIEDYEFSSRLNGRARMIGVDYAATQNDAITWDTSAESGWIDIDAALDGYDPSEPLHGIGPDQAYPAPPAPTTDPGRTA